MTLKQLQRYLETEKWRETAKRGADVCGCYARCAYCNRYDEYPCAEAYRRYLSDSAREENEFALPEPPVKRVFGTETAETDSPQEHAKAAAPAPERATPAHTAHRISEGIPVTRLVRKTEGKEAPAAAALPVREEEPPKAEAEKEAAALRRGVIKRGVKGGDKTRVLIFFKKGNYGEAEF